jgi:uncharacterized protein (DUF2267 family)
MSRQDILDDPVNTCPQLHQFLAGYFHQDWADRSDRWEPVIEEFVTESPHSVVVETADELAAVLAANLADDELDSLLDRLGANVSPPVVETTLNSWLEAVLQGLRFGR